MWCAADQFHQVKWICSAHPSSANAEEAVHRPHVIALANETLHKFETMHVGQREVGLNAVGHQALDVFEIEIWRGVGNKVGHCVEHRRVL